jgi:hypothetical protein
MKQNLYTYTVAITIPATSRAKADRIFSDTLNDDTDASEITVISVEESADPHDEED